MIVGKAIYYLLTNDANIAALVDDRVYPEIANQQDAKPYVVYNVRSNDPSDTQKGPSELDTAAVEINCYAPTYETAIAISVAVRAAIDRVQGTYNGVNVQSCQYQSEVMGFDEPQRLYRVMADYQVRILRSDVTLPQVMIDAGAYNLDDLSDVNAPNPTDGQALIYDDATSTWIPGDVSATLAALTDVNLDEPLDREALVYDEATSLWINGGPAKIDFPVYNNDNALTIAVGTVVAFTGVVHGDRMGIAPFSASSANDPRVVVGIAVESIGSRQPGHVRSYGNVYGMNTNAYTVGTILYASTTAGQLTSTPPTAPNHRIAIAVVTKKNANSGRVFCRTYTPAYRLADLSNVASTTPSPGEGLVFNGSTWAPGKVGYVPGSPPPGGFLGNVFYQDNAGNLTFEDEFRYTASTNTLAVENITGTTVTGSGVVKGSNTFGQRYATQAATNRAAANTASITVERYFTVTAEGNGESFNIQSNTPSAGNKIVRKIWYKDEAFEATDVDTWTLLHTFADDTTYANTAAKWQEYLDGQTYGKPPFTLAISWEEAVNFVPLLDGYTTDLRLTFSVCKMTSTYTGSCFRVRRASDNTEQDIGFTVAGDLDTAALTTFCTGTDGFLVTWYEQSGRANTSVTQTTTANQPKIYDSSAGVLLDNFIPAFLFDFVNDNIGRDSSTMTVSQTFSFFSVHRRTGTATGSYQILVGQVEKPSIIYSATNQFGVRINGGIAVSASAVSGQVVASAFNNTTANTRTAYINGVNVVNTTAASFVTDTRFSIGSYNTSATTNKFGGNIQAIVYYNADKSSDRAAIEARLNDYFNVY